ncbi:hypothetical protein OJ962_14875 [Solirubrobacter sp. CPCC 204708]|uniref:Uncharacterized protein n=1 Tax=Solirubrobacter deserti TaxID=2282478 RepID=A0ABT4RJQ0_9ACTN|nr:hypothetical protein [Solirubrobacter deserti]MDA0138784.1 hypothetical protein [Solirubrobacter deserti]
MELHVGMLGPERAQQPGEAEADERVGLHGPDADEPAQAAVDELDRFPRGVRRRQRRPGLGQQRSARVGERHLVRGAVEELGAQLALEGAHPG